jgi:hypothetical protein
MLVRRSRKLNALTIPMFTSVTPLVFTAEGAKDAEEQTEFISASSAVTNHTQIEFGLQFRQSLDRAL